MTEINQCQLPVQESLCYCGVKSDGSLIVSDTRADERTRSSRPVTSMGRPSLGQCPGSRPDRGSRRLVCVADTRVRGWTAAYPLHAMAVISLQLDLPARFLDVRGQRAGFVLLAASSDRSCSSAPARG